MSEMKRMVDVCKLMELSGSLCEKMYREWVPQVGDFFTIRSEILNVNVYGTDLRIITEVFEHPKWHSFKYRDQNDQWWEKPDMMVSPDVFFLLRQLHQVYGNSD